MIVVKQVDQIEVFFNKGGSITIRQMSLGDEYVVEFPPECAEAVIRGINAALADSSDA